MRFETERLRVRFCEERDCDLITQYLQDEAVIGPLETPPMPFLRKHAVEFYSKMAPLYKTNRPELFVIATLEADTLIGCIGIHPDETAGSADIAKIGYWLGRPFWKRGFLAEAARPVLAAAFTTMGWAEITGYTNTDNLASQNVLKRLGFVQGQDRPRAEGARGTLMESCFRLTSERFFRMSV